VIADLPLIADVTRLQALAAGVTPPPRNVTADGGPETP